MQKENTSNEEGDARKYQVASVEWAKHDPAVLRLDCLVKKRERFIVSIPLSTYCSNSLFHASVVVSFSRSEKTMTSNQRFDPVQAQNNNSFDVS